MIESTLTAKNQTTIPRKAREALGLKPGDKLQFLIENGAVRIVARGKSLRDLAGSLPKLEKPLSLEEIDALIRERAMDGR